MKHIHLGTRSGTLIHSCSHRATTSPHRQHAKSTPSFPYLPTTSPRSQEPSHQKSRTSTLSPHSERSDQMLVSSVSERREQRQRQRPRLPKPSKKLACRKEEENSGWLYMPLAVKIVVFFLRLATARLFSVLSCFALFLTPARSNGIQLCSFFGLYSYGICSSEV